LLTLNHIKQTAVAGLGALAVFDLDGRRVALHLGNGADDLVPAEIAGGDLEDDVLENGLFSTQGGQPPSPVAMTTGMPRTSLQ
jgi:hypothetical protein